MMSLINIRFHAFIKWLLYINSLIELNRFMMYSLIGYYTLIYYIYSIRRRIINFNVIVNEYLISRMWLSYINSLMEFNIFIYSLIYDYTLIYYMMLGEK